MFLSSLLESGVGQTVPTPDLFWEGANCSREVSGRESADYGVPFRAWRPYFGDAAIPERAAWGRRACRCVIRAGASWTYRPGVGLEVQQQRGTFTGQCLAPLYPGETAHHPVGRPR